MLIYIWNPEAARPCPSLPARAPGYEALGEIQRGCCGKQLRVIGDLDLFRNDLRLAFVMKLIALVYVHPSELDGWLACGLQAPL